MKSNIVNVVSLVYNFLMNLLNHPKIKKILDQPLYLFIIGFFVTLTVTGVVFTAFGLVPKEISSNPDGGITLESNDNTTLFGVDFTKGTNKVHNLKAVDIQGLGHWLLVICSFSGILRALEWYKIKPTRYLMRSKPLRWVIK